MQKASDAYARLPSDTGDDELVCVANLSPVPRYDFRVGLPRVGAWTELLNTDAAIYGGSNMLTAGAVQAENTPPEFPQF